MKNGILLYEDNNGCVKIANNLGSHKLAKHIDIKYHFAKERVGDKSVRVEYISTENQVADVFTKPLGPIKFSRLRKLVGLE